MHRVTLAFLCVLCCSASCLAFTFADCGSTLGKFTEVSVSGCQTSDEKCALVRGTNASISIAFTPNTDITQVNARVYGVLIDIPVPFPLDKPDACKDPDDGISCPLHKNQEYHYRTSIFVQNKFPKVSVDIKWELVNEKNENIVCIEFPAKIK
ncbi:NPC intracellular cholesterol transporter 2 homolog a isoform X4 [Ooceraea biroi]|uniref:NPC intracellular cholesterol transporter 2 homolog a isoform X4 n=1 Tax=Ooceraea biroi TaxID=2015173 RepID=UPI0009716508|nr:NPC intracellular cholesterol transporter 2 homolog a isoform X4 [Ooceraea biroi]